MEVLCSGVVEKYIQLRSVKTLKPVGKPQPADPGSTEDWLTPKVYKGTSDRESG